MAMPGPAQWGLPSWHRRSTRWGSGDPLPGGPVDRAQVGVVPRAPRVACRAAPTKVSGWPISRRCREHDAYDLAVLESIGLSAAEQAIYLALLGRSPANAAEICSRSVCFGISAGLSARGGHRALFRVHGGR